MENKIKIAIADDHTLVTQSLARCLEIDKKFVVVGLAENGKQLLDIVEKKNPDVIIMDLEMPVMNGWETLDQIKKRDLKCKIVIISMHFENLLIKDLVEKGASGFLPKNSDFETLINAIHEVNDLGYFFSKKINRGIVKELLTTKTISPSFNHLHLSEKELETLKLLCADKLTKEIASELNVTERTIERYKGGLYEKTKAKTVAGLALFALRNNYISL